MGGDAGTEVRGAGSGSRTCRRRARQHNRTGSVPTGSHLPIILLALLLWFVAPARATGPSGPVVIDRVMASVGDRVITMSDVALERELRMRDPSPVAAIQARRDDPMEALIDLALARGQAGDISVYEPTAADVRERMAAVRGEWPDPRDWVVFLDRVGHTEEQLAGALYSRMVAERYILRNVTAPARGRADDPSKGDRAEARAYERWVAEQRRRVTVRLIPPLTTPTP